MIDKDLTRKRVSFLLLIVGNTGHALALLNYSEGGELVLLCLYRVCFAVHLHLFIGLVALAPIVSTSFRWGRRSGDLPWPCGTDCIQWLGSRWDTHLYPHGREC